MRLLYCGSGWLPVIDCIRSRLPAGSTIDLWERATPLRRAVEGVEVILPSNTRIDADIIAAAPALRLIQQPASGTDVVDLEAARARGIPVCNAPAANHVAVAECALFLMLAVARRLPRARRSFAAGEIGAVLGGELRGKRLGIVGLGRSERALAEAARGLGMEVDGVRSRDDRDRLLALLARSDVVSIHCPHTPATDRAFDDAAFAAMKPGAILVNCARGGIIDRAALERALARGGLTGVGLDVFWDEPWDPDDPLFTRDDVVTLPHVAGSTHEAFARIADIVADNVRRVIAGEPPRHRVD